MQVSDAHGTGTTNADAQALVFRQQVVHQVTCAALAKYLTGKLQACVCEIEI